MASQRAGEHTAGPAAALLAPVDGTVELSKVGVHDDYTNCLNTRCTTSRTPGVRVCTC